MMPVKTKAEPIVIARDPILLLKLALEDYKIQGHQCSHQEFSQVSRPDERILTIKTREYVR